MPEDAQFDAANDEQRFQRLVNAVTDYAIYMLDPDGRIVSWNAGAKRFKGYAAEEIIGRHFSCFLTDEDRAAGIPSLALKTAAAEGRFESEGWRIRKDGTRFWANVVVDPIRDDAGRLLGYAKITRDVSDKREAQQALFESEQRFRLLVQGVRDYAIYMLDPQGHVINWNAGAEAIKGYAAEEIVGQHFSRFYPDEERAAGVPAYALATALAEGKYEKEGWRVRKDGTRLWAHVVIDPIYDNDGRHLGFAKITRDVTERREAQERLEEARVISFQSQKLQALGELTGGVAHDFNNLMTVICGSAQLLRQGNLSEEKRTRYLDAIIETADRAATLTSHLLAFGRRQALTPEITDLNVRLDALAEVLDRTLGSQIEIVLDLAPDLWPTEVDSAQLETALLNAAFNARDAMPEGGRLTLSTRNAPDAAGDMIRVVIADTGEGMPAEVLKRAFEPFFTTKPVGKGTGLGLSQIHGFAAQTGGRVEIESAPGKTVVSLFLPRASGEAKAPPRRAEGGRVNRAGLTVLLVEDNDRVREFAGHLLEDFGFRVLDAGSTEEALELLEDNAPDLLFSDVVMPGKSGVELARIARGRLPELPVLLASGYSEEVIRGAAAEFELLRKPYVAESLDAALGKVLERRQVARD